MYILKKRLLHIVLKEVTSWSALRIVARSADTKTVTFSTLDFLSGYAFRMAQVRLLSQIPLSSQTCVTESFGWESPGYKDAVLRILEIRHH